MKITEIFDLQNNESNLILDQNYYFLIHDYEDYKNRLHNHSVTLELLTQRALNLSLFRGPCQKWKLSKPSYHTKSEKLQKGVVNGELSIIKKLLMVNLRSFKIMQKLFQENRELQILLSESRIFAKKQKQKIEYVRRENESLKNTEVQLKRRLGSLFRQLNRMSKGFIAGFRDDCEDDRSSRAFLSNDKIDRSSQKLELAFNFSTNVAYRLRDDANKFLKINTIHQDLTFSCDLDIEDLKISLTPGISELPLNNVFGISFEHVQRDREIKYPLLMWKTEKPIETPREKTDSKESNPKIDKCPYKIDKEVQNAIRLHYVNSTMWRSFLVMKTIREFVLFDQVYELIKAFAIAGEACDNELPCEPEAGEDEEISSEPGACEHEAMYSGSDQTVLFRSDSFNRPPLSSESTSYDCVSQNSLTLLDETMEEDSNRKIKKHFPRIKVFYSLKRVHKKFVNWRHKKIRKCIPKEKFFSEISNVSIGVGDCCIESADQESQVNNAIIIERHIERNVESVDQESQFDNDILMECKLEKRCTESNVNIGNEELDNDSSITTLYSSRRDFRKSLKSLEDVIKSCQQKCEPESTAGLREKLRKKRPDGLEKNVNKQRKERKGETKAKEVKKKKRNTSDSRNVRENRKISSLLENRKTSSRLPEMSKMYQIILQNQLPRGVSFEYMNADKSKVQMLFVSSAGDSRML